LSDEDRDSDASQAEGSQAGAQRRAKTAQLGQEMGSASGDSGSEAGPPKSAQKGKGKQSADAGGKANPKKWASEDDDSGSEFEGPADEDEEEEDDELEAEGVVEAENEEDMKEVDGPEDEDMDGSDIVPVSSPKPKPRAGAPFTGAPSHSKQATYVQSEANLIPQEYRDMVKSHSQIIAAIVRGKPKADDQPREYKTRALDPELLPSGPTTPFVSRLKREVKGRESPAVYYDERLRFAAGHDADKSARQMFGAQAVKAVPLLAPWQLWQGEGWWPEMAASSGSASHTIPQDTPAAPATSKHKGKGKATHGVSGQADGAVPEPGWILRKDVRLGLERVGRYRVDEMKFLSEW
jgi:transcription factor C subunit 6